MGKGNEMWAAIAKPFAVRWAAGRLSGSTPKKPRPEMQAKAKPSWSRQLSDLKASASEVARTTSARSFALRSADGLPGVFECSGCPKIVLRHSKLATDCQCIQELSVPARARATSMGRAVQSLRGTRSTPYARCGYLTLRYLENSSVSFIYMRLLPDRGCFS
jgi:hypothetical protein